MSRLVGHGRAWPLGIALGLLVVVVVNFAFVYIATQNAPQVESSYETVDR